MKNYIYILPFKDEKYFKIGISSNNLNRVNSHDNTYGIDKNKSLIFEGSKKVIKALESSLLSICPPVDVFTGKDGHTEVREIKHLEYCLDFIKFYESKGKIVNKEINLKEVVKLKKGTSNRMQSNKPITTLTVDGLNDFISSVIEFISDKKVKLSDSQRGYSVVCELSKDDAYHIVDQFNLKFTFKNKGVQGWYRMGVDSVSISKETEKCIVDFYFYSTDYMKQLSDKFNIDLNFYSKPYNQLNKAFLKHCG